jgi:hypothetical protein
MKATPISRKYALPQSVTFALERRVELITGLMMSTTTTAVDMITKVNKVKFAARFP